MTRLLASAGPATAPRTGARTRRRAHDRRIAAGLLTALAVALFVTDLRLQPGGEHATRTVDDLGQLAGGAVLAASAAFRARRSTGRLRLSWALIAVGAAGWAAGQTAWSVYELVLSVQTPFPSLADAGYLLLPTLGLAGLLVRPSQAFTGRGRLRVGLDILLVLASLFTISWATAFGQVYRGGADTLAARLVGLAYPAGDVALLTVVVIVLAYANAGNRAGLLFLGGGLGAFAVGDSGFAYLTSNGSYATGNLVDVFWVVGFLLMAWAAALDRSGSRQRVAGRSYLPVVLPFVPTLIGLGVVAGQFGSTGMDAVLLAAAVMMVVVLLVRQ
ncbi:MAG TPA: hypothetical protein VHC23_03240, partial [Jatrophihabitans sp.]|nr:hypothetical protein [Jatrophihabitans sp.]